MTTPVRTSAPGKLILIGEYAVLEGAPAAVMAVNRRAQVSLEPSPNGRWKFSAPGLAQGPCKCVISPRGELSWEGDKNTAGEQFALVESLMRGLTKVGIIDPAVMSPAMAVLDTRAFFYDAGDKRFKLGLGSSAALTVALASALRTWAGVEAESGAGWLQTLVDLHRGVQGGRGSGVDVAASLLGGALSFQLESPAGEVREWRGRTCSAVPLTLPEDLRLLVPWTGRSASTREFLERLETRRDQEPRAVEEALTELGSVSAEGVHTLENADAEGFLKAVEAFWDGLEELERVLSVPILSQDHRRLRELAASCGGVYKPSGAGGGDLGLAMTIDPAIETAMRRRISGAGYSCLDLTIGRADPPPAERR